MILVDVSNEEGFPHPRGHAHCGDSNAGAEAEAYVAREVQVRERIGQEGIVFFYVVLDRLVFKFRKIVPRDTLRDRIDKLEKESKDSQ